MSTRWKLFAAVGFSLAISIAFVGYRRHAEAAAPLPVLSQLEGFALVDQSGAAKSLTDLRDRVWVADFIFTGCQAACPMLTTRMHSLQEHLADRERALGHELPVRLVSFSVDPEVDTPDKLAAYAARWSVDTHRWMFLTGPLAEVNRAVVRGLKIPFEKGGADTSAFDVMHGEHFVLVDGQGRIRGYFDTDVEGMARIKQSIEKLLAEKGA